MESGAACTEPHAGQRHFCCGGSGGRAPGMIDFQGCGVHLSSKAWPAACYCVLPLSTQHSATQIILQVLLLPKTASNHTTTPFTFMQAAFLQTTPRPLFSQFPNLLYRHVTSSVRAIHSVVSLSQSGDRRLLDLAQFAPWKLVLNIKSVLDTSTTPPHSSLPAIKGHIHFHVQIKTTFYYLLYFTSCNPPSHCPSFFLPCQLCIVRQSTKVQRPA